MNRPSKSKQYKPSVFLQLLINFVIPIFILTRLSSKSELGPTKSFLLALAFPVGYELYSVWRRRKISILSLSVIGGILATGAIGLLGLSEGWLAIRRSAVYFLIGALILAVQIYRPSLVKKVLDKAVDLDKIMLTAKNKNVLDELNRLLARCVYSLSAVFFVVAVASYALTRVVIKSPTDSEAFNQEYAELRVIGIAAITLPLILGLMTVMIYFSFKVNKITGLDPNQIAKKR